MIFEYKSKIYPSFIKDGNHQQYIRPIAEKLCTGKGIDIGCNRIQWAVPGYVDLVDMEFPAPWDDAFNIPAEDGKYDFVFSSHCLEHLGDYYSALEEWTRVLKSGGTMLLYLPHRDMEYWLPQNNRKHRRICDGRDLQKDFYSLGFTHVDYTGRDLAYSFAIYGVKA